MTAAQAATLKKVAQAAPATGTASVFEIASRATIVNGIRRKSLNAFKGPSPAP